MYWKLFAAVVGIAFWTGLSAPAAVAQGTGGTTLYQGAVQRALDKNRTLYEGKLKELLSQRDLIADGVSLYDISIRLASSLRVQSQPGKGCVVLDCALADSVLECTATTPPVELGPISFRLGKCTNPRFEVRFDLRLSLTLAANGLGPMEVKSATLEMTNLRLKPKNIPARVVKAVDSVGNFFSDNLFGKKVLLKALEGGFTVDCKQVIDASLRGG